MTITQAVAEAISIDNYLVIRYLKDKDPSNISWLAGVAFTIAKGKYPLALCKEEVLCQIQEIVETARAVVSR